MREFSLRYVVGTTSLLATPDFAFISSCRLSMAEAAFTIPRMRLRSHYYTTLMPGIIGDLVNQLYPPYNKNTTRIPHFIPLIPVM